MLIGEYMKQAELKNFDVAIYDVDGALFLPTGNKICRKCKWKYAIGKLILVNGSYEYSKGFRFCNKNWKLTKNKTRNKCNCYGG